MVSVPNIALPFLSCTMISETLPVFDLHCDLLSYMTAIPNADPVHSHEIGSSLQSLREGNVKLQTMAVYVATGDGSVESGIEQSVAFLELIDNHGDYVQHLDEAEDWTDVMESERTTIIAAIENASAFCGEDDDLDEGLAMFETMVENTGGILYVSLTHNDENRFGGGNDAPGIGLKDDGKILLEFLNEMNVAVDLSHSSDALARDILEYIDRANLAIPIIASHSNFRTVHDHVRNLPDDIVQEIVARQGLIGMNFYREFVHETDPKMLYAHILHGIENGAGANLAFGSDFFFSQGTDENEAVDKQEDFFHEHRNSAQFQAIIAGIAEAISEEQLHRLAYGNIYNFLQRIWG
jgi:membrane dipeptidase